MSLKRFIHGIPEVHRHRLRRLLAVVPPEVRQPRVYRYWVDFLQNAQRWPAERIRSWQLERLQKIVELAIVGTEGYRELYKKVGLTSGQDLRDLSDLRRLPFTSKQLFRDNLSAFAVAGKTGRYITTGGSTGIPFGFRETFETSSVEDAFMHAGWSWTGWKLGTPSAVLRGGYVGSADAISCWDPFSRELALSSYFLTAESLPRYVSEVEARGLRVLQAYPSSMNLLCDLIKERKFGGRLPLENVFLGSENVYPWQLDKFRIMFPRTRFFAWYGHCEKAVLAPWCEQTTRFHAWPFYGVTEVLADNGHEAREGQEGEIVGTGFHQELTPFIRYRTMDHAEKGPGRCEQCGREFPMLNRIMGRAHEVIVTKSGRYISMTAINMHDDIFDGLRQFQFLQETPGRVTFKYVPKERILPAEGQRKIAGGLRLKLGDDMVLELERVDEIPRTQSGKYRFLDQRMDVRYGDSE